MSIAEIEKKADEIVKKISIEAKDIYDILKVAGLAVIICVIIKIWRKNRG